MPPVGYRTLAALQLHAAAVLTDSGGVQREAAWLGVPCLVLRDVTEWTEAVAESGGLMVTVGLDAERARAELARPRAAGPRSPHRRRPGGVAGAGAIGRGRGDRCRAVSRARDRMTAATTRSGRDAEPAPPIVRQACTLVLPSNGAFDSAPGGSHPRSLSAATT